MRSDHTFQFDAGAIADAAERGVRYHEVRLSYWRGQLDESIRRVRETAGVVVEERQVTGGTRVDVAVDHGDPIAYAQMQRAQAKIAEHTSDLERLSIQAHLYGSQDRARTYELDADDVLYFGLVEGEKVVAA